MNGFPNRISHGLLFLQISPVILKRDAYEGKKRLTEDVHHRMNELSNFQPSMNSMSIINEFPGKNSNHERVGKVKDRHFTIVII